MLDRIQGFEHHGALLRPIHSRRGLPEPTMRAHIMAAADGLF
jgi:hypothetical protein